MEQVELRSGESKIRKKSPRDSTAIHRLRDLERIAIVYLTELDIVRHPLVQKIVQAYEEEKPRKKRE